MVFSKLTGVGSECGSGNKLNNFVKHFGKDRTFQQDSFFQRGESSQSTTPTKFRTRSQNTSFLHNKSGNLTAEFFQQNDRSNVLSFFPPISTTKHSLQQKLKGDDNWSQEFSSGQPSFVLLPPSDYLKEFEQVYSSHPTQQQYTWTANFHQQTFSDVSKEEGQQLAFERAFEEFDFTDRYYQQQQENRSVQYLPIPTQFSTTSSQTLDNIKDDWEQEFSKYNSTADVEPNKQQASLSKSSLDNIVNNENCAKPKEKSYGYRALHPEYETYTHTANNPYLVNPDIPHTITSLADTILSLEAKAQLDPKDAKTWEQLGLTQQENGRDDAAITALEKAVTLDPLHCSDAWLALSISYTNEHCRLDAYNCLEQWIANCPKYKHTIAGAGSQHQQESYYSKDEKGRHLYITNLFLDAARTAPTGKDMDADVQVGLGVLFNVSEEYGKAVDCFRSALMSRPDDYLLWNRVGATLAHAGDSVSAMEMYGQALEINPLFVRARYNLAIGCMNLNQHREAVEHLLTALALQQAAYDNTEDLFEIPTGRTSDGMWDSLRLLMYIMNRQDLASQCDHRNLGAFQGQFDF